MEIKYICVHHFGPKGSILFTQYQSESEINSAHRQRWPDFPSKLNGSFIGYNAIIYFDGYLKQYRFLGEETAAQKGHNLDTVSICLAGNFTKGIESPTPAQKMRLKAVMEALLDKTPEREGLRTVLGTVLDVVKDRIVPHRVLQPYHTDCYGNSLSDSWARDLLTPMLYPDEEKKRLLAIIADLYRQILAFLVKQKFGTSSAPCQDADVRG